MDIKDSSDEDGTHNISAFTKFDESIEVQNAEEIQSPIRRRPQSSRRPRQTTTKDESLSSMGINSPRGKLNFRRYSETENSFGKSMGISSDPSDSEESDDDDDEIQGTSNAQQIEMYNPKDFEGLDVSAEVTELFQNIVRYTPQKIELNYKLIPFIPDYIPAVGDIDAFIKIPRPDGVEEKIGLTVLDEPCTDQSDPAVLHLQLRSHLRSAGAAARQTVVKRIEDAEKNSRSIDKWIEDINQLHRSKHPPVVHLTKPMPDIDSLLQQWPPEIEEKLNEMELDFGQLDCDLSRLVDIICNLLDIPADENSRLEALHTLFTLFLEVRNARAQKY
ncbi:PREDICTED: intraflagellar transport protein 46 homolog [Dufourea novaeangliae]|uniref:Intraflagellar transport protein 46 homolog n=1 Tax=Dufourea novaeangliae TaxID=178035 RepID=A0A154PKQ5_DUFNO|nr:PREDICTED: intraflagellar transport protein 46 homolog [Dufourea novaeangliae]KZC11810.1 Intraflagellar transport protein 46 like protein [Dufourea novaeangliae]